jgi:hypothetical protein
VKQQLFRSLREFFGKLNESEIIYPGADMQLVYEVPKI